MTMSRQDENLLKFLQYRCWVMHCVYTIGKILIFSAGKSSWLEIPVKCSDQFSDSNSLSDGD